jgi:hypothetical protein
VGLSHGKAGLAPGRTGGSRRVQPACRLGPDGKQVWVQKGNERYRLYELPDGQTGKPDDPPDASVPGRWYLRGQRTPDYGNVQFLYANGEGEAWLRLENDDGSQLKAPVFSRDGRFLAWTTKAAR